MKYYRVVKGNKHDYFTGYTTVIDELLTERERNTRFRYLSDDVFEIVSISKYKTYKLFGARFEAKQFCMQYRKRCNCGATPQATILALDKRYDRCYNESTIKERRIEQ